MKKKREEREERGSGDDERFGLNTLDFHILFEIS